MHTLFPRLSIPIHATLNISSIPHSRFFDDLEKKRAKAMDARNASEEKALEGFRSARKKSHLLGLCILPYVLLIARKHVFICQIFNT